ncbi:6-hydroxymethylpterin diphosphokinase MptE-like protein [Arcobacter sp. L]|uniref:6-hydroxymethylpterin diphosphokinase MptE-like protein n=1 Tax=Arcobacter sp. L TaxID=944547 RepID=UPI0002296690|nr:6-hydroxymethylpterin diphosphokinase MptE-like protein [Arcobacter sp. L]BAK74558.1 conserved hypothetical protein [Arcobacter sp. L]
MIEAQIQLQNALITTFLANLAFLSEYDNELYHRVDELSRMIENGTYQEKYALEFIMENGDFDIYDIVNDKYLYNKKPKKINDDLVRKIEFDEKFSIFNIEDYFTIKTDFPIDAENRFNFEKIIEFTALTQKNMFEYSNSLKDFLGNKKKKLKKIKKFIFLGTLLGRHIPRIAEKIDADMYLILEKNIEIFRLSLFTIDYTILGNKGAIFSIMDDDIDEDRKIRKFIDISFLDNYLLKFSTTNINIETYIDKILSLLVSKKPNIYDYNRELYSYVNRVTKVLNSEYRTLIINQVQEKCNLFDEVPVLYLAAGPSLDENIEWIKEHQNKFFIVTIGAAYKKLLSNNIRIDMITTLDENVVLNDIQFDDFSVSKLNKETIILANSATNSKLLKKLKPFNLFLYESQICFHKDNISLSGFSVGEVTLNILLKMNIKNIYLLGLDLALNQKTGLTHSENSDSGMKVYYDLDEKQSRDTFGLRDGLIKIKGNLLDEVNTTSLFYMSIRYLKDVLSTKNENINIYNLSSHGAYFNNTSPKKVSDINMKEFSSIDNLEKSHFVDFLVNNSLTKLTEESTNEIKCDIDFLKHFMENRIYNFKNSEFKNYEELLKEVLEILNQIEKYKYSFINLIMKNYYRILFPYLSYHFNDIKVKDEEKKIKKIKKIFEEQIENILNDYILCLERIL